MGGGGRGPPDIDVLLENGIIGGRADVGGLAPTGIIGRAFRVNDGGGCIVGLHHAPIP